MKRFLLTGGIILALAIAGLFVNFQFAPQTSHAQPACTNNCP